MDARRFMVGECDYAPHNALQNTLRSAPSGRGRLSHSAAAGMALHQAFDRFVVVILQAGLVPADLAIELVDQLVQRRVKIFM